MAPKMHLARNRARVGDDPVYVPHCGNRASKQVTQHPLEVDCLKCGRTAESRIESRARYARLRVIEAIDFYDEDEDRKRTGVPITLETPLITPGAFTISAPHTFASSPGCSAILLYYDQREQVQAAIKAAGQIQRARELAVEMDKGPLSEADAIAFTEAAEEAHGFRNVGDYWSRQIGYREEFEITKGGPDVA